MTVCFTLSILETKAAPCKRVNKFRKQRKLCEFQAAVRCRPAALLRFRAQNRLCWLCCANRNVPKIESMRRVSTLGTEWAARVAKIKGTRQIAGIQSLCVDRAWWRTTGEKAFLRNFSIGSVGRKRRWTFHRKTNLNFQPETSHCLANRFHCVDGFAGKRVVFRFLS